MVLRGRSWKKRVTRILRLFEIYQAHLLDLLVIDFQKIKIAMVSVDFFM